MEKRQHKRYTRRCEAEFSANGADGRGIASNFSLEGLFIRTSRPFKPDTPLELVLHLPDGSTSELKGKVKRAARTRMVKAMETPASVVKNGMGVEITKRDAQYLHFIRSLLGPKGRARRRARQRIAPPPRRP